MRDPASKPPRDLAGRETGRNEPWRPSEDPLAPSIGLMVGICLGCLVWIAVILVCVVIT